MTGVLVIAPHLDDETLGCGGALLRHQDEGDAIHWLLVTSRPANVGIMRAVAADYDFATVRDLGFTPTTLDTVPTGTLIGAIAETVQALEPETLYVPFPGDAHSDHRHVFEAAAACFKWFRYPSVKRVYACEIPSETDFGPRQDRESFRPTVFVDIARSIERKIGILGHFAHEMGAHPFPRSEVHIRALAVHRGAQSGFAAAEAFMLIKEAR